MAKTQAQIDRRIDTLHLEARKLLPKLQKMMDELKALGPHSVNGHEALENVKEMLHRLSGS